LVRANPETTFATSPPNQLDQSSQLDGSSGRPPPVRQLAIQQTHKTMKTKVKTKTKPKTFLSMTEKQIREQAQDSFQAGLEMRRYLSIYRDEMQKLRHQHFINQCERRIKELNR
jgi:hypothetical protein